MMIDRAVWADAYKFHVEAVKKLGEMAGAQDDFWMWAADRLIEISNAHGNSILIMGLLIAVFEDLEQRAKIGEAQSA